MAIFTAIGTAILGAGASATAAAITGAVVVGGTALAVNYVSDQISAANAALNQASGVGEQISDLQTDIGNLESQRVALEKESLEQQKQQQ